ncbi:MAG: T9SS type A sorting domain-containing protein [Bacteroidales bacterium]|nr:T9SS type A sorting domain-containing protein [Bacteroidales bacterium]
MNIKKLVAFLLLTGVAASLSAQNMNRYITVTAPKGSEYYLSFNASVANPVKVMNDSAKVYTESVKSEKIIFADTVVTIYGDVTDFGCRAAAGSVTALDVSHNTVLTKLLCNSCSLSSLDVRKNIALKYLDCYNNRLAWLDVTENTALTYLDCGRNRLPSLNVGRNIALQFLDCSDNKLLWLDVTYNKFLTYLCCSFNGITSLDVSNNKALVKLYCGSNNLSSLNVGGNTVLEELFCGTNNLSLLDVGKAISLVELDCRNNKLTSLDVSKNTSLNFLSCGYNSISSLDVSEDTALVELDCSNNRLSYLNLKSNAILTNLDCSNNGLTSLDVRKNKSLREFRCYGNRFTTEAYNTIMCALPSHYYSDTCRFFPLYWEDDSCFAVFEAANSDNAKAKGWRVLYGFKPPEHNYQSIPICSGTYRCPEVDMKRHIGLGVMNGRVIWFAFAAKSEGTPVNVVCGSLDTILYADKFTSDAYMTQFTFFTTDTVVTIYGDLTQFRCSDNGKYVYSLDVRYNTALERLHCDGNSLTSLDVGSNTALTYLRCDKNNISSLDVSGNTLLEELNCYNNSLTSLDVSKNVALAALRCHSNLLPDLHVGENKALKLLSCRDNPFSTAVYDKIMCDLPAWTEEAKFWPLYDSADANYETFMAANSANVTSKGWSVLYGSGKGEVPATSGKFDCATLPVREAAAESAMRVWPNPARTQLHIAGAEGELRVHDLTGRVVYRAEAGNDDIVVNIADWAKGMYFVRSGCHTLKFVKE